MIAVCGEALVDVVDGRTTAGGSPFNTARALARLGVPAAFVGHLSNDAHGRELRRLLAADAVSLELVTYGDEPTTAAMAHLDSVGGAVYEFVVEGTSAPQLASATLPADVSAIQFGSLGVVLEPMAATILELVERERSGRAVVLDPNVRPGLIDDEEYRRRLRRAAGLSTIVKASAGDLAWTYPGLSHPAAAVALLDLGVRLVVVTLGAQGAFAAHAAHRVEVPAVRVQVVDTIGAGDAFGAALLAWLHDHEALEPNLSVSQMQLREALDFACLAAAITCSRAGADPPRRRELVRDC